MCAVAVMALLFDVVPPNMILLSVISTEECEPRQRKATPMATALSVAEALMVLALTAEPRKVTLLFLLVAVDGDVESAVTPRAAEALAAEAEIVLLSAEPMNVMLLLVHSVLEGK